jgi:uncharacterized protein
MAAENASLAAMQRQSAQQQALDDELFAATQWRYAGRIVKLIASGANPNSARQGGVCPLHQICKTDSFENCAALIDGGADVNSRTASGDTPLLVAASVGFMEMVELLYSQGARVDISNSKGVTPILAASKRGTAVGTEIAKYLPAKAAPETINTADYLGMTPLHYCAVDSNSELAEALILRGANLELRDHEEATPLIICAQFTINEAAKFVRLLLAHGADVNAVRLDGWSSLHLASWGKDVEVVKALLEGGADVELRALKETSALHIAADKGTPEIINTLVEAGALVNGVESNLETPLHSAVRSGRVENAKALLALGANPDSFNQDGESPLTLSLSQESDDVLGCLLKAGADPTLSEHEGELPAIVLACIRFEPLKCLLMIERSQHKIDFSIPVEDEEFGWDTLDDALTDCLEHYLLHIFLPSMFLPFPAHRNVFRWALNSPAVARLRKVIEDDEEAFGEHAHPSSPSSSDSSAASSDASSSPSATTTRSEAGRSVPPAAAVNSGRVYIPNADPRIRLVHLRDDAWKRRRHLCIDRDLWWKSESTTSGASDDDDDESGEDGEGNDEQRSSGRAPLAGSKRKRGERETDSDDDKDEIGSCADVAKTGGGPSSREVNAPAGKKARK